MESQLSSTLLGSDERMPVLKLSFPLVAPPAGAWQHRFECGQQIPVHLPDGRTVEYSNPKIKDLPRRCFLPQEYTICT